MLISKYLIARSSLWRNYLMKEPSRFNFLSHVRSITDVTTFNERNGCMCSGKYSTNKSFLLEHCRFYCKVVNHGEQNEKNKQELSYVSKLFPQPRVTLYELSTKTPQKIFDVHYKQIVASPKSNRKKIVHGDWVCTYTFIWPEKMKFESTALSKRQAAEKAATMALHWLYFNKHIDIKGCPIYDKEVLEDIRSSLFTPIEARISDNSMERIERIWNDYESGIKPLYEATFKEAAMKSIVDPVLAKDSSLDEDEFSDDETKLQDDTDNFGQLIHPVYGKRVNEPTPQALKRRELLLKKHFEMYDENLTPLPIDEFVNQITSTLESSRVAIIVGAAGCGKSTRAPAAILRHCGAATTAIVSEPRRVAAIGLAQRVASELCDETPPMGCGKSTRAPAAILRHCGAATTAIVSEPRRVAAIGLAQRVASELCDETPPMGCGKSTRALAAILRHCGAATTAIVSEPRRVAAIGLAQRVASELCDEVGGLVGYQVRLQSDLPRPPCGSILYCTSGVLLRRLQTNPGLKGCSHVIIDEAHERDVNTDITLLLLKRALEINHELKVIVMSATLDIGVFTNYFQECPVIEVPGRTFPVQVSHLEDIIEKYGLRLDNTVENCKKEDGRHIVNCQEVVEVIKAIDSKEPEGAILVFLPGWADIKKTKQMLDEFYKDSTTHMILPVHSRLSTTDQTKMFVKPLPGTRKIVLATNVAETSITIPDVVYVVDTGLHKENRTKEGTGTASLETVWVSLAAANQRTGRAGRVQPGHCYRLYTKEKEAEFEPHSTPEILRVPLEQTVLDCKTYAPEDKVEDFLSQLPEPPSKKAIEFAVNDLIDLGALTATEQITRLGSLLSSTSLPPRLACSMLLSAAAGDALSMANVVAHCGENLELFVDAADRRDEIREFKRTYSETSDHAALHKIQSEFENVRVTMGKEQSQLWCERRGLRWDRLNYVKRVSNLHLENLLKCSYLEPNPDPIELTRFSDVDELTAAILLAGANSLLVTKRKVKTKGKLATIVEVHTTKGDRAHIGSESVNHSISKRTNKPHLLAYYGGMHSHERRALVVYKSSVIPPVTALLFCKRDIECNTLNDDPSMSTLFLPKHHLQVRVLSSQAPVILKTREMLWNTFQYFIDRDLKKIRYDDHVTIGRFKTRLVKAVCRILVEGHREYVADKSNINIEDDDD